MAGAPGTSFGRIIINGAYWGPRTGTQAAAQFGFAVAGGDLDRDGFSDVFAGEPAWDGTALDQGRVVGYRGSASGLGTSPSWFLTAP